MVRSMKLAFLLLLAIPCVSLRAQVANPCGMPTGYVVSPAVSDGKRHTDAEINSINRRLAAEGNIEAKFQLGLAYMQGVGVKTDAAIAERYFAEAATTPENTAFWAGFYCTGLLPENPTRAAELFQKAARSGDLFEAARIYQVLMQPPALDKAIALYRKLLQDPAAPEHRRAELEMGNLVLDGRYSAGDDAEGRQQNLDWARSISQELLGQVEYTIAVAYSARVDGVPEDREMWHRFCRRAAAYDMDLAQRFYADDIFTGKVPNANVFEGYAWLRLASEKQTGNKVVVEKLEQRMSPQQKVEASSYYEGLVETREKDGAYYSAGDPLREPSLSELAAMPQDDPDVQLREAFALGMQGGAENYVRAMQLYRTVRDRREIAIKMVLSHDYQQGTNGVSKNERLSKYWMDSASKPH